MSKYPPSMSELPPEEAAALRMARKIGLAIEIFDADTKAWRLRERVWRDLPLQSSASYRIKPND